MKVKTVKNFARFWALFNRLQHADEELKQELVGTYTGGRTVSLREMTPEEYDRMCTGMQAAAIGKPAAEFEKEIKKARSKVLHKMQKMGIDTADWAAIDRYCLDKRIAGKVFRQLSLAELKGLMSKLFAIDRKTSPPAPLHRRGEKERVKNIDCLDIRFDRKFFSKN